MPIILDKHIGINSRVALWQITESEEELRALLIVPIDPALLAVNEILRKQRIASRILIAQLYADPVNKAESCKEIIPTQDRPMQTESFPVIQYDEYNKPFLLNSNSHISISHSHDQVAVILNKLNETGIDIELIKPQVERIATRFMHEKELMALDENRKLEQLTTIWCAKETLYKYFGKKNLSFSKELFIEPFYQLDAGSLIGHIQANGVNSCIALCYEKRGEYMLVYVND